MKSKRASASGRTAPVEVSPRASGFILSIGPLSVWLPLETAKVVVATLERALLLDARVARAGEAIRGELEPKPVGPSPPAVEATPVLRRASN
jgi:hypothetical protein